MSKVVEFDLSDSWQMQSDIDAMTNPTWWVERYLKNNWEYQDEQDPAQYFHKASSKLQAGRKTTSYDVARDGA